jgi:hypothetical protein
MAQAAAGEKVMNLTPEQKEIRQLKRDLGTTFTQLTTARISRDQWRKRAAAKDEKGSRSALAEVARLKRINEVRTEDCVRLRRSLAENLITINDMNIEIREVRGAYDAKREHAIVLQTELARHIEAAKRRPRGKAPAPDSPKNWKVLNDRDAQWRDSIWALNEELCRVQNAMMDVFNKGPMPPITRTPPDAVAAIYRQVPDPAEGNVKLERITRDPSAVQPGIGDSVPGGNGVWFRKRKSKSKGK